MKDNLIIYALSERLIKPFSKWNLFQNGSIDEKGRVLKEVSNLDRFLIRLKKMVSEEVLATFITFMGKNKETRLETKYIVEQFERTETIGKVDQKINEILLKNNLTRDEYYNYLLEKLQFDEKILEGLDGVERLRGGKGDGKKLSDFDPMQVVMGLAVEREHSNDIDIISEIIIDHLTEFPDYYTRLDKMENEAKNEK